MDDDGPVLAGALVHAERTWELGDGRKDAALVGRDLARKMDDGLREVELKQRSN